MLSIAKVISLIRTYAPVAPPEVIAQAVTDYLENHPEIEVADGSITEEKLASDVALTLSTLESDVSDVKNDIQGLPEEKDSNKTGVELDISDPAGYVALRIKDGHIQTEHFNSKDIKYSQLNGKVIVNFGDSIFGKRRPPNDISTAIANATGATVYNCAFGGCRMAKHDSSRLSTWGQFSMFELADAIADDDWTGQDAAIEDAEWNDRPDYFAETLTLLKSIDFSQVDIATIAYGTNDFTAAIPLDDNNNPLSTSTFAGALRYSIETLLTAFPNLRIICCGQCYRWWDNSGEFVDDSNTYEVGNQTLPEFVAKTADVAKEYNLPFIDNYNVGIGKFTRSYYFSGADTTHPNNIGTKLIAQHIIKELF